MGYERVDRLERLRAEISRVISFDHPKLSVKVIGTDVVVEGEFSIVPSVEEYVGTGRMASFAIKIEVPISFPKQEPKVYETGKAFPHTPDYHCNDTGDCCICVYETWRASADDTSFGSYLNGPIRNFFLSQHIKNETNDWPFGEWDHGRDGYLDACADRLECDRRFSVVAYNLRLLSQPWPKGHWMCPCGSQKIVRQCCAESLRELAQKVGPAEAQAMRLRLFKLFKKD